MKNIIIILSLLTISFNGLSQNKKEQIVQLNNRIDSCQNVIASQSSQIKSLSTENKIINDKLVKTESDLRIKENF